MLRSPQQLAEPCKRASGRSAALRRAVERLQEAREAALEPLPRSRSEHLQRAQLALSPLPPPAQSAPELAELPRPSPQPLACRERQERERWWKPQASTVVLQPPPA